MKLLANENVEAAMVEWLRETGDDVAWAVDMFRADADECLLQTAQDAPRVLLTRDRDFGNWFTETAVIQAVSFWFAFKLPISTRGSLARRGRFRRWECDMIYKICRMRNGSNLVNHVNPVHSITRDWGGSASTQRSAPSSPYARYHPPSRPTNPPMVLPVNAGDVGLLEPDTIPTLTCCAGATYHTRFIGTFAGCHTTLWPGSLR
ncbi:MAG: DUF5615 family PIN-like protein [Candidatus Hydrogenedentota bacterium]